MALMPNPSKLHRYSPSQQFAGLVVCVAGCVLVMTIGAWVTVASVGGWYTTIEKPTWNPPNWLFSPVWTTLFLMMAVSAWLVWRQERFSKVKFALGWFAFHLILNLMWSILFFGLQQIGWAAIEIILLWGAIVVLIVLFYRHSKWAALLLIPYLLWVTFASTLTITIWTLN